jgi:signal transduction histidine kinase
VASVLAIARDITEFVAQREDLEEQARRRTADLQAATRGANLANQAKGDFLALMSHETRLDSHQSHFVEAAKLSGRHLLELVNDALDLAKIDANEIRFERESVDLRQLLREAIAPFIGMATTKRLTFSDPTPLGASPRCGLPFCAWWGAFTCVVGPFRAAAQTGTP